MSESLNSFIQAGKISEKIVKEIPRLVFDGQSYLDVAETIEKMIYDNAANPGFPVNVSVNHFAAHYTPSLSDTICFSDDDVVKIDFGVSVDGCVSDQAITIDLSGKHDLQVQATRNALLNSVSAIKAGATVGDISRIIETEITKKGFRPISNLGGHMIRPYLLHAGVFIPNAVASSDPNLSYILKEGDVFAIEPFATSGKNGKVVDSDKIEIFSLRQIRNVRLNASRQLMGRIIEKYSTLPFARRWLQKDFPSKIALNAGLTELARNDMIFEYPVLKDINNEIITQEEVTVVVEKDGCRPLVQPNIIQ